MNFGYIREQVEADIGATVNASTLGRWINAAQVEISKSYGKRTRMWMPPFAATLTADITAQVDTILVDGAENLPESSTRVMIGDGGLNEIIYYETSDHLSLIDVQRGMDGTTALPWPAGTEIRELPVAGKEYPLPDDILTLHDVRDTSNSPIFNHHITPDNMISVFGPGAYYINYTKVPAPIDYEDNGALIEVHSVFQDDIVQYCLYRYWQSIAEGIPGEENKAQLLLSEFNRSIEKSAKHLKRIPNQQYTIGVELW